MKVIKLKKGFYERNSYLLEHEVNKTFEEVLWMSDEEFRQWLRDMRKEVAYSWDELGFALPRVGWSEDKIISSIRCLVSM